MVARTFAALVCILSLAGCSASTFSSEDITKLIAVTDVKTGYFDAGVENGMNKLLPTITLTLKNVSTEPVTLVQLNAVIRRAGETEEWGGGYIKAIGSEGLPAGTSTKPIVLKSNLGYTSVVPRNEMLTHRLFVDAHVQVFVKHGGAQWVKLGEYQIARELLPQ